MHQHSHKVRWQKDLKFLQTFRPQRSVNNTEEAAERTDILYDPVSYWQFFYKIIIDDNNNTAVLTSLRKHPTFPL